MKRLVLIAIVLVLGAGAGLLYRAAGARRGAEARYNVVLIMLDTVRADRLGCYGGSKGLTPEIDRFAREAVRFEQAFAHAPWTLPSIASLFTSRYPVQHGAGGRLGQFRRLPDEAVTLAEAFQRAGAATHAIINVLFLTDRFGMTQGFDTVDASAPDSNEVVRRAGATTDAALAWLDGHGRRDGGRYGDHGGRPFFLFVHYFDAHLTYDPPQPYRERFAAPEDRFTNEILFGTRQEMVALRAGLRKLEPELIRRLERLYDGEVAYVDSQVGRLLAGLTRRGLDDRTIVVITADHGEEFLEHDGFEHGHTLYDELLRVPLLIRVPEATSEGGDTGAPAAGTGAATRARPSGGGAVAATVRQIDVAPTLCELAGLAREPGFEGDSLVPLMQHPQDADRPVLSHGNMWGPSGDAWRKERYKLIRRVLPSSIELFDVQADPGEKQDLSARETKRREQMEKDLDLILRALASRSATGEAAPLSAAEIERLKSLGYIGED